MFDFNIMGLYSCNVVKKKTSGSFRNLDHLFLMILIPVVTFFSTIIATVDDIFPFNALRMCLVGR